MPEVLGALARKTSGGVARPCILFPPPTLFLTATCRAKARSSPAGEFLDCLSLVSVLPPSTNRPGALSQSEARLAARASAQQVTVPVVARAQECLSADKPEVPSGYPHKEAFVCPRMQGRRDPGGEQHRRKTLRGNLSRFRGSLLPTLG